MAPSLKSQTTTSEFDLAVLACVYVLLVISASITKHNSEVNILRENNVYTGQKTRAMFAKNIFNIKRILLRFTVLKVVHYSLSVLSIANDGDWFKIVATSTNVYDNICKFG